MAETRSTESRRRDQAARAAWLYFIAGRTQDEIATRLEVSRQAAQRLVAFAVSEKLIKFRLDHPIASCMLLAERIMEAYGLEFCDVTPSDTTDEGCLRGVAIATATRLENLLLAKTPIVLCVGTGRTMRAAVAELGTLDRPQHKIASLVGSMAADGHASPYDVVMQLADKLGAQRFPMPAPVLTETDEDREALHAQRAFQVLEGLREQARASFVGIGALAWQAPIHEDGFATDADITELLEAGAVAEVLAWPLTSNGEPAKCGVRRRVASLPLETPPRRTTVVAGCGPDKVVPLCAALRGRVVSALITDENTARAVLEADSA